jgi:hypothetical protein
MTITPNLLTRWAGLAAVAAGAIFIGVQINHPDLNATSIQTTNVYVRDCLKVLMAALALAGITGMYLNQIRRHGVLGLIGYVVFSAGYLGIMAVTFFVSFVSPGVATPNARLVNDAIAVNTGRGTVVGDIGALQPVIQGIGFAYLIGGLLFGVALYRARVLPRWAAALLAVGGVASAALTLMPDAYYRLIAFPNGIAMVALGYSLWKLASAEAETQQEGVEVPQRSTVGVG